MAQPISVQIPPRDPRKELIARLEAAPQEHAEALLDSFELLQHLHDRKVFELLRGALSASDTVLETTVGVADSQEGINTLRNLIILARWLGSINPELLQCIAVASTATLGSHEKPVIEPPGLFSLLSQFRHRELRRSIALINRFLEVLGTELNLRGKAGPPK
jgi:uncharacterized protein YjgD (DUF1641 family)